MDWKRLDQQIDELEGLIPSVEPFEWIRVKETWAPVWEQCKLIQDGFRTTRYPSVDDRHAAWNRFQGLRLQASEKRRWEDEAFARRSEPYRDMVLEIVRDIVTNELHIFQVNPVTRKELLDYNETV